MSNDVKSSGAGANHGSGAAGKQGPGGEKPNHVNLTVVVNTDDTVVEANVHWKLQQVAEKALEQTGTTSRDLSQWRLKDATGNTLDLTRTVESYGFQTGTTLFLSLEAGHNG